MSTKPLPSRYGLISRLLHWSIALLFISLLAIGWAMVDLGYYDPWYHRSLTWHKGLGVFIGLLVLIKLSWLLFAKSPDIDTSLSAWEHFASIIAHKLLLVAMVALPLSGYLISSSAGDAIEVFNWFNVPALIEVSTPLRDLAITSHFYIAYIALAIIIAHISGALKHHIIDKKDTLKRML
jgi:cytochrome b561